MEKRENLYTIGEISRIFDITIKALRYYEKIGLLTPYYVDPDSKYRYYSINQFIQLDIIKAGLSLSISPTELKGLLTEVDTEKVLNFIGTQKNMLFKKIDELQNTVKSLDAIERNMENSITAISKADVYFREIPKRTVLQLDIENLNEKKILSKYAEFYSLIEKKKLINTYETGFIFKLNSQGEFFPSMIYNTVIDRQKQKTSGLSHIEGGKYLCISYNKNNAVEQQTKINDYLENHKLQPKSVLQVDLLNDFFKMDSGYYELQIHM